MTFIIGDAKFHLTFREYIIPIVGIIFKLTVLKLRIHDI